MLGEQPPCGPQDLAALEQSSGSSAGPGGNEAAAIGRVAGAGGLAFAAFVLAQNIIRAKAPGFNAAPAQVTAYFLDHRAASLVPLGLFPAGMLALLPFVAAVWTKASQDDSRWWASVGALGAATVAALFAVVNITEIVLTAKTTQLASSPAVVQALWTLRGPPSAWIWPPSPLRSSGSAGPRHRSA
ncbi:MAG: hypothetical protein ACR2FU_20730 [Streptosporangiaceae bacterium]